MSIVCQLNVNLNVTFLVDYFPNKSLPRSAYVIPGYPVKSTVTGELLRTESTLTHQSLNTGGSPRTSPVAERCTTTAGRVARESQDGRRGAPGMSEFWHKIGCCVVAKPPPKKRRRKIDRTMIGEPTNFVHLTHIGSGEMADGMAPSGPVQQQMRSKVPHSNGRNSLL
ncbi:CDC42 small effector protein 1 [Clupea harengus]|uniref:CDC42 small effector protein 1 n=1 Tax=Clupea harengus TaxID=7950 RepID=A0A6P8FWR5_CLUHA|nr:CDC42 small effector protein 1 [Clupea harengus]